MKIDVDNVERILLLIIEKYGFKGSVESVVVQAEEVLEKMVLYVVLGDELKDNINLQSGLSAVINSGKRAFKGGIKIINSDSYLGINLPGYVDSTIGDLISNGIVDTAESVQEEMAICIGCRALHKNQIELKANSWQGGIIPYGKEIELSASANFILAGNMAGGFAVAYSFMTEIGIIRPLEEPIGLSLWRPDLDWLDGNSSGPDIKYLPTRYWIVGLGHLGQSFQWVLSQLPKKSNQKVEITLQDYDEISNANYSAGLLAEKNLSGMKKTRVSSDFLERHGYFTRIIERGFDKTVLFSAEDDPPIILCGVDSANARENMNQKAFPLFLDSGLGGTLATFDAMAILNFRFMEIDDNLFRVAESDVIHKGINDLEEDEYECGVLSRKAISSSFVGIVNASIVVSEIIRSFNQGMAFKTIDCSLRDLEDLVAIPAQDQYDLDLLKFGRIEL